MHSTNCHSSLLLLLLLVRDVVLLLAETCSENRQYWLHLRGGDLADVKRSMCEDCMVNR